MSPLIPISSGQLIQISRQSQETRGKRHFRPLRKASRALSAQGRNRARGSFPARFRDGAHGSAAAIRILRPVNTERAATVFKQDYYAVKSHLAAARAGCMASSRLTRSARRHGDTEIGFEAGLRAASSIEEGRASKSDGHRRVTGIEEERESKRDGNCCRDVCNLVLKTSMPSFLRALRPLRVDRPEAGRTSRDEGGAGPSRAEPRRRATSPRTRPRTLPRAGAR